MKVTREFVIGLILVLILVASIMVGIYYALRVPTPKFRVKRYIHRRGLGELIGEIVEKAIEESFKGVREVYVYVGKHEFRAKAVSLDAEASTVEIIQDMTRDVIVLEVYVRKGFVVESNCTWSVKDNTLIIKSVACKIILHIPAYLDKLAIDPQASTISINLKNATINNVEIYAKASTISLNGEYLRFNRMNIDVKASTVSLNIGDIDLVSHGGEIRINSKLSTVLIHSEYEGKISLKYELSLSTFKAIIHGVEFRSEGTAVGEKSFGNGKILSLKVSCNMSTIKITL